MFELTTLNVYAATDKRSLVIAAKPVKETDSRFFTWACASAPAPVSQCISADYRAKQGAEDEVASLAFDISS